MEVKYGFLIFVDVEGDLICVRSSSIETVFVDGDENLYITTNIDQYQVADCEKIAYDKILRLLSY